MKKLITSIAALVLFAGMATAAETTANTASTENKTNAVGTLSARSLAAIIDENISLRMKVEEITEQSENLKNKLDYSFMMHSTISNLKNQEMNIVEENKNSQLDYAHMMTTTLVNLNTVLAISK